MSVELIGWHDEHSSDHRRRLRNAMLVSLAIHGSIFGAFAIGPTPTFAPMPQVIAIDLVAAPPAASRPSRRSPAPPPPKAAPPEPPPPEPAPPAPPVVKAPVQVLPEESPGRIRKVKPKPKSAPPRPKREKSLSYEDAMAELGVDDTADLLQAPPAPVDPEVSSGQPESSETSRAGAVISPELAAWNLATRRRIQNTWVTPSNFRNRGLATTLELRLSVSGDVMGTPKVVRSSGDPYFDDNAVSAVLKAAPLPPPPEAGQETAIQAARCAPASGGEGNRRKKRRNPGADRRRPAVCYRLNRKFFLIYAPHQPIPNRCSRHLRVHWIVGRKL